MDRKASNLVNMICFLGFLKLAKLKSDVDAPKISLQNYLQKLVNRLACYRKSNQHRDATHTSHKETPTNLRTLIKNVTYFMTGSNLQKSCRLQLQ